MAIKKIKISNFKSFRDLEVELGNFNVLIGANASGKSNFIQIFKFLKDIISYGLDNAISMQGGIEYLRNINIGPSNYFSFEIISDLDDEMEMGIETKKNEFLEIRTFAMSYKFDLIFKKHGLEFGIADDRLTKKFNIVRAKYRNKVKEEDKLGKGEIIISNFNGKIKVDSLKIPEGVKISEDDILPMFLKIERLPSKTLIIGFPYLFMPPIFSEISMYDFDPKLPKKATPITGKAELEEDGSNLAIVLKNIIENREKERKFCNLIRDLLPFVDTLNVEKFADKSLLFKLQETYTKKQPLPASLISDGTINITALIIALYFEEKLLTIIEEPERNIHPYLISKVVDMMKEASQRKQIIVTTHNPEIVKYAEMKNILLISRNSDGFSTISRPYEKEEVRIFLENEMGVEELYAQNLLGA